MRAKGAGDNRPSGLPGWDFWRRRRRADGEPDEAERWLDLAGFADGRLKAKDRERIAALLRRDPGAAADVAAARVLGGVAVLAANQGLIARAAALIDRPVTTERSGDHGRVIALPLRQPAPRLWHGAAGWSSLAAVVAVAGWLGFGLGSGMLPRSPDRAFEDAAAGVLLDPAPALVRDFTEGWQT